MPDLDLAFEGQPGREVDLEPQLHPDLDIVIADDEQAVLADVLDEAVEAALIEPQLALAAHLKAPRAFYETLAHPLTLTPLVPRIVQPAVSLNQAHKVTALRHFT